MIKTQVLQAGYQQTCYQVYTLNWTCWGSNLQGESDKPLLISNRSVSISNASVGRHQVCVIMQMLGSPRSLYCWGNDEHGQSSVPAGWESVDIVSAGDWHTCAIKSDGTPVCFGMNTQGQLDLPSQAQDKVMNIFARDESTCFLLKIKVECIGNLTLDKMIEDYQGHSIDFVSMGSNHICTIFGQFQCYGLNNQNQIDIPRQFTVRDSITTPLNRMSSQSNHTCTTFFDRIVCWGQNDYNQISEESMAIRFTQLETVTGHKHTCAKKNFYPVECWGQDKQGQIQVPSLVNDFVQTLSAAGDFTCVVKNAVVKCFGKNQNKHNKVPAEIQNKVAYIRSGQNHSCGIFDNATNVSCWGTKTNEIIEKPDILNDNTHQVKLLALGFKQTCSICRYLHSGHQYIVCWGLNSKGAMDLPSHFKSVQEFDLIVSGMEHLCAIVNDHKSLHCWGSNDKHQSKVPTNYQSNIRNVAAGQQHTCAVSIGATVCWGSNVNGQVDVPSTLRGNLTQIAAGGSHSCGINQKFIMSCWGSDKQGQLKVKQSLQGFLTNVELGMNHSCTVDMSGMVKCSGDNEQGQLNVDLKSIS